jgi:hypothetical protein
MNSLHSVGADKTEKIGIELRLIHREAHSKSTLPHILTVTENIDVRIRVLEVDIDANVRRIEVEVLKLQIRVVVSEIGLSITETVRKVNRTLFLNRAIEDVYDLVPLTVNDSGNTLVLLNVCESVMERSPLGTVILNLTNELILHSHNTEKALQGVINECVTIVGELITVLLNAFDVERSKTVVLQLLADVCAFSDELI